MLVICTEVAMPLFKKKLRHMTRHETHLTCITSKIGHKQMDSVKNTQKIKNKTLSHPQCQFFVARKKRLCRMTVRPGRNYCGEHEPQPLSEKGKDDTRIPCPYDPKHTCYASKLLKHLAICNGRQLQQPDYIVHNVNAPADHKPPPRKLLSQIPQRKILALIDKVNILYDKYLKDNITTIAEKPIHTAVLKDFEEKGRAESSLRHLKQASSLLHLIEAEGLVQNNTCYVELGAGKGQLSYYAYTAWCGDNSSQVVLVDRASLRHKRDNKLREPTLFKERVYSNTGNATNTAVDSEPTKSIITNNGTADCSTADKSTRDITTDVHSTDNSSIGNTIVESTAAADDAIDNGTKRNGSSGCCRIRADLRHLALENVAEVSGCTTVVGFAKHLCGEATDYALRCITSSGVVKKVSGVVLATCCHHRCESATYIATEHLQEMGINAEDLNIMLGMVSWATCGDGRSRERRNRDQPADSSDERSEDCDGDLKIKRTKFRRDDSGTQFRKGVDQGREQSASQQYDHDYLKTKTLDEPETVKEIDSLRKYEDKKDAMDTSELGASLRREANPSEDERQGNEGKFSKGEAGNEALGTGGLGLSAAQRQEAGRRAKALLDEGRARFLRARGLRAGLARFVAPRVSPENVCIVAGARQPWPWP